MISSWKLSHYTKNNVGCKVVVGQRERATCWRDLVYLSIGQTLLCYIL